MTQGHYWYVRLGTLLKATFIKWNKDEAFTMASSLSYYAIFSLPPLLLIIVSAAGKLFGKKAMEGKIAMALGEIIGPDLAYNLQLVIANSSLEKRSLASSLISFLLLLIAATGLLTQLQNCLDKIWKIKPRKGTAIIKILAERIEGFLIILLIGCFFIMLLFSQNILRHLGAYFSSIRFGYTSEVVFVAKLSISVCLLSLLFGLLLKILSNVRLSFRLIWPGALITAILFILGKYGLQLYLSYFNPGSAYGKASFVIILLIWVFYSSLLILFGAEFTQVYSENGGRKIRPNRFAKKDL